MPRTAQELLTLVEPFGPGTGAEELVFAADPPADLVPVLSVLHTAVRALLTRRRWWGAGADVARVIELNTGAVIPAGIDLLCVEGDESWDRIHPDARSDLPALFASSEPPPSAPPSRSRGRGRGGSIFGVG